MRCENSWMKTIAAVPDSKGLWASRKNVLNGMRRGFSPELHITNRGNPVETQFWIFHMSIDYSLPDRRRKAPFIQLWQLWWRSWWKKACHASLIEQVGFIQIVQAKGDYLWTDKGQSRGVTRRHRGSL